MSEFREEHIVELRDAVNELYDEAGKFSRDYHNAPALGSQAIVEQDSFPNPDAVASAYLRAVQLIESAGDHVIGLVKSLTEPIAIAASWTCVRSMLEPCAIASWLLDPALDVRTRVARSFAMRYEGLEQHILYGRAANHSAADITKASDRLDQIENDAITLGYPPVVDKKGRRIGIGQQMPGATQMIKDILNEEVSYRLLSAVAHGHQWALTQLLYKPMVGPGENVDLGTVKGIGYERTLHPVRIARLIHTAGRSFAHPLWNQCRYFGWDALRLEEIFETAFDKMYAHPSIRFWRSP